MIHKHAAEILSALIISDNESTQILGNVCVCLLFSSGTLKFQIEHTARKKLTRLKKSTNHLARDTKIGHDIEAIDI